MASNAHRIRLRNWRLSGWARLSPAEISALVDATTSQMGMDDAEKLNYRALCAHRYSKRNRAAYVRRHLRPEMVGRRKRHVALDRHEMPFLNFLRSKAKA